MGGLDDRQSRQARTAAPGRELATELASGVLEALPDAVFVARGDALVWGNRQARQMLGVDDLGGRRLEDVFAPGELHRLRLLEEQRHQGWELPPTMRIRLRTLGSPGEVTADLRVAIMEDVLLLSARDLSAVTRAEELMGKLARLFARGPTMPDADALLDKAEPIFEELGWRAAFTEITGPDRSVTLRMIAPPGDPVGDYGRSILGVELPFDKTPVLARVVRTGQPIFLDNLPTLLPDAPQAVPLSESMARAHVIRSAWCPVLTDGRITHLLAITGRDLTEHDFVAVQLFAAQLGAALHMHALRADLVHHERLAAVGEMAAVMAHEVRNPLGVMFNALASLEKPDSHESTQQLLAIMREEAERLRRLVTDLLDFSRPPSMEVTTIDLREILHESMQAARQDPSCAEVQAKVSFTIASGVPPIETDAFMLRRAFVNLLVNALQHVVPGGRIAIDARLDEPGVLKVRIENDGPGLAPEVRARMFEPFFTTRASGTGLGLAIVRRSVQEIGGRVFVEATPTGTAFVVQIPTRHPGVGLRPAEGGRHPEEA